MKRNYGYLALIFILIFTLLFVQILSVAALSKQGSRGDEVTQIQTKLSELGYYNGKLTAYSARAPRAP